MSADGWGYPDNHHQTRQGGADRSVNARQPAREKAGLPAPSRNSHGDLAYSAAQALAYAREMRRLCRDGSPGWHCAEALAERAMAELRRMDAMTTRAGALFAEKQP